MLPSKPFLMKLELFELVEQETNLCFILGIKSVFQSELLLQIVDLAIEI